MSGRNEIPVEVSNLIYGIVTTGNPKDIPKGAAQKLVNAELIKPGIVSAARGYTPIGKWVDNRVCELLHFIRSGVDVILCFGINSAGTSAGVGIVSGTWASGLVINDSLTGCVVDEQISLVEADDYAYFFDGTNDSYFDGTNWLQIGLDQPNPPTTSNTYDGSLTDNGVYKYEIRRYNENTGARSKQSTILTVTAGTSGANTAGFVLSFDAGDSSLETHTEIYRTVAYGTKMYREGSVSVSATTYNSEMADDTLTRQNQAETGDDRPPAMKIVRVGGSEMLGVETANPNRVRWCRYSPQYGTMYQSWPAKNLCDCDAQDNDKIKTVFYHNETWFVFKDKSMGVLVDVGGGVRIYRKLADVGIVGIRAVMSFGSWIAWMSQNNIHATNGTTFKDAGGGLYGIAIQDDIKALVHSYGNRISACTIKKRNQIRFTAIPAGQTQPKKVFIGHTQYWDSNGMISWTTREQGPIPATYPGIQAGAMAVIRDSDGVDQFIFGNSNGDGYIYKGDYGDSDNGSPIFKDWHFHRESFGTRKKKTFADFEAELKTESSETQVQIGIRRNGGEAVEFLKTASVGQSGFTLDSDSLVESADDAGGVALGEEAVEPVKVPCNREAQDAAVVIRNSETNYMELRSFTQVGLMAGNQ